VTILEVVVLIVAVALAAAQLGWFLGPRRPPLPPPGAHVQETHVHLQGGFGPDTIVTEAGKPLRLVFHREDPVSPRSDRLKFNRPIIDEPLPAGDPTPVEFTPPKAGDYRFRCGRSAFGVVLAVEAAEGVRGNLGRGHKRHG
jgi:plastocyanin domain-containing protein